MDDVSDAAGGKHFRQESWALGEKEGVVSLINIIISGIFIIMWYGIPL